MLANTITLSIDPSGDYTTFENDVMSRFRESENKTQYRFDGHTLSARDMCEFYRNEISPSGNYLGNAKGTAKLTTDGTVLAKDGSDIVSPIIANVSFSIPVGTTDANFYKALSRLQALVIDKALAYSIFMKQDI
jgi:hypothetical protein